jgi:hypothetical protein
VDIKGVRCALYPVEAALWIDPDLVGDIRPYRLQKQPPNLVISGVVDMKRPPARTRLDIGLDAPRLDYTFCGKELQFANVTGKLSFADARMRMTDIRAQLFDGTIKGDADISLLKDKPGHAAHLEFGAIDFTKLTKLYFDYDASEGKLNGVFDFTGAGGMEGRCAGKAISRSKTAASLPFRFSVRLAKSSTSWCRDGVSKGAASFGGLRRGGWDDSHG